MKKQKHYKQKQIVRVRERNLSNGETKFYLDINVKGQRRRTETLDYVYLKNPKTKEEKYQNELTLATIQEIRRRKENELLSKKYSVTLNLKVDTLLLEYVGYLTEKRKDSKGNHGNWDSMLKHLKKFYPDDIQMGSITKKWVEEFKDYLQKKCKLSSNSSHSYFNKFLATLTEAIKDKIILENPAEGVSRLPAITPVRHFLTEEELKKLANAECRYDVLKRAFLFSVLTGLRWSDVSKLEWTNIDTDFEKITIRGNQEKTDDYFGVPLQPDAIKLMGERCEGHERVFKGLKYSDYMNVAITKWCLKAGITKPITFHCARHSFAYLLLKKNVNIYTISKLLGHSHVKTTEIYLHLLDKDKHEAIEKLPILNLQLN